MAYTYNKLILAYGPRRSYTVSISWRPQSANPLFTVTFGQFSYLAIEDTDDIDYQKRINPHHIVQQYLADKFNKTRDLIDLAEYLVNTTLSIHCITQLARHRIRPAKLPPGVEQQPIYNVEYPVYVCATSEYLIRVTVGPVHLEFLLLSKNSVCLRDVTPDKPLAHGLHAFIETYKRSAISDDKFAEFREEFDLLDDDEVPSMTVPDNIRPPGSLQPPNQAPLDIPKPRSVPDSYVIRVENENDVEMEVEPTEIQGKRKLLHSFGIWI